MRTLLLALSVLSSSLLAAETSDSCLGNCDKARLFPMAGVIKPGRKYARDRLVDIQHLALEVTPDFKARTVAGSVTLTFSPIAQPLSTLELDAMDLQVEAITAKDCQLKSWQNTDEQLVLNFAPPIPPGQAASVTVQYHCQPKNGLHFRTPEMGYEAGDTQVWSQGEAEFHRYWFPCYDYPNERFTSEVTCHAPEGMEVISNGKLLSQSKDAAGLIAWHWSQEQPHVNYLIALAAGYFHKLEDHAGGVPLAMLVPPSEKDQAALAFRDTKNIMDFFQQEIGVPFPWAKYQQVYCLDFLAGGMENTSCSFMAAGLLFPEAVGTLGTLHRLDAHEMAHQWFGDLLTCRDWSHLWLNEGFASYYTILFEEQKNGREGMIQGLRQAAGEVIAANDTRPMVWRDYGEAMQQFDTRAYPKGAWVLHMLRSQLGRKLYQLGIRTYIERHRNGIVTTDDLQAIMEEVSGRSLDQFFDQWVHHGGVPNLEAHYGWDEKSHQQEITIRQTQKVDEKTPLFNLPLPVRFFYEAGGEKRVLDFTMKVTKAEESFYFPLTSAPDLIRVDPDLTVLAKWVSSTTGGRKADEPTGDFLTRVLAVQELGSSGNDEATRKLLSILASNEHQEIRIEAAKALQGKGTAQSRTGLLQNLSLPDDRVRFAVVEALSAVYHREIRDALARQLEQEKNPKIIARCLGSLAAWPDFNPLPWLKTASYHGMVSAAVIELLGNQNKTDTLPQIMEYLASSPRELKAGDLAAALETIGKLSREHPPATVLALLTNYLTDPNPTVRSAAAKALGTTGDPASISVLQRLAKAKQDQSSTAATEAIAKIQARTGLPEQTLESWKRVQELEQKSAELTKRLEKLEGRAKAE